jgi:hypothetical protein
MAWSTRFSGLASRKLGSRVAATASPTCAGAAA